MLMLAIVIMNRNTRSNRRGRPIGTTPPMNNNPPPPPVHNEMPNNFVQQLAEAIVLATTPLPPPPKHFKASGDVIPLFDPSDDGQDINNWLHVVDQLAIVYRWTDEEIVYNAFSRLRGNAEVWYRSVRTVIHTWEEWKGVLERAFPTQRDYATSIIKLMDRKKRNDEDYSTYYYAKNALLNECEITGSKAVSILIHGIVDPVVASGARSGNFTEPEQVLLYLTRHNTASSTSSTTPGFKSTTTCHRCGKPGHISKNCRVKMPASRSDNGQQNYSKPTITCHKCGKPGHYANKCNQTSNQSVKCTFCQRTGHVEAVCRTKQRATQKTEISN